MKGSKKVLGEIQGFELKKKFDLKKKLFLRPKNAKLKKILDKKY